MVGACGQRDRRILTPWGIRPFPLFLPLNNFWGSRFAFRIGPPRGLRIGMDTEKKVIEGTRALPALL